jgi:signal transduction histidine kinase
LNKRGVSNKLHKIFNKDFQVEKERNCDFFGRGLGLESEKEMMSDIYLKNYFNDY